MSFLWDLTKAFLIGGAICAAVQIFIDRTSLTPARILVALVTLGVILGAVGVYKPFVELAGCGASTPLTGFGYTLAEGVRKAVDERDLSVRSRAVLREAPAVLPLLCFSATCLL
jgi:stage V sporulation protein AE